LGCPFAYANKSDWYARAKIETEKAFLRIGRSNIVIIRPGIVYGARTFWSRMAFERVLNNRLLLPDVQGYCYAVHPLDLSRLIERAIVASDSPKVIYASNPEQITWESYYAAHAKALGVEAVIQRIPVHIMRREMSLSHRMVKWGADGLHGAAAFFRTGAYSTMKWVSQIPFRESILKLPKAEKIGLRLYETIADSAIRPHMSSSEESYRPLYPSSSELEMYQSNADLRRVEVGQSIGFKYEISLEQGCENAALWWSNKFIF
jgi:hypothetical protein